MHYERSRCVLHVHKRSVSDAAKLVDGYYVRVFAACSCKLTDFVRVNYSVLSTSNHIRRWENLI